MFPNPNPDILHVSNTSNHYFYFIQEIRCTHLHFIYSFRKFEIYSNLYKYMFEI